MRTRDRFILAGAAGALAVLPIATRAQSSDSLIDKLIEKGILTLDEANELRDQADKDFTKAYSVKSGMPDWVTTLRIGGDLRGRFEGFYGDQAGFVDRTRWRYRLRAGFTAVLLDDFEVGFRLGSGDIDNAASITRGTDPISNNQSFQNNASKKGIFLDTVYAKWSPIHTADWAGTFTLGKMESPFVFSELVFDGDYTPEGLAEQFTYTLNPAHALKLNLGQFVLDELSASSRDPFLLGQQLRFDSAWNSKWSSSVGVGYLAIEHDENLPSSGVPDINVGNLRRVIPAADGRSFTLGAPVNGFGTVVLDAALTYTLDSAPLYTGPFPIRIFGDFLQNLSADGENEGYSVGITFGRAGRKKTWEFTYRWKHLEGDAWWEELTDSDSGAFYAGPYNAALVGDTQRAPGTGYGSGTNYRGHWIRAGYSPLDSLTFNVTFISLDLIDEYLPGTESHMDRLQVDAVWRF